MGYESKIVVAEKIDLNGCVFYCSIAEVNMCVCDTEFVQFFENCGKEIKGDVTIDGEYGKTDKYGDVIKEVSVEALQDCLDKVIATKGNYRRYMVLKGLLSGFNVYAWDNEIVCLHYGY